MPRRLFVLIALALTPLSAIGEAELLFRIPEHDFFPENIAYDPVDDCYYLGSMSHPRILRIEAEGSRSELLPDPPPGLSSVVGMKVDAERRRLWVCTGRFSLFADYEDAPARTSLMLFDLPGGSPVQSWILEQPGDYHIFNDLDLDAEGRALASTTLLGALYRATPGEADLELLQQLPEGSHNNGVALGPAGRFFFFTADRGLRRLDLSDMSVVELTGPEGAAFGCDGLYFHEGTLIAVKPRLNRVSRLRLGADLASIVREEILAENLPGFAYPTTGVIVEDRLVLVSTSYADRPRRPGEAEQHGDLLIHGISLKEGKVSP